MGRKKLVCPIMSDGTHIRYCTGSCALSIGPAPGEYGELECAFKHIGYVARNICDTLLIDWAGDVIERMSSKLKQEGARHGF